jgi:hypothetical protein
MVEPGLPYGNVAVVKWSKNAFMFCQRFGVKTKSMPIIMKKPPKARAVIKPS